MSATNLTDRIDDLIQAVEGRDPQRFGGALQAIADGTPQAGRDEVQAALTRLAPVLDQLPFGIGGDLAQLTGAMTDYGTDPAAVLPTLVNRAIDAMEHAARFAQLHEAAFDELPDAGDPEQIEATVGRFADRAAELGLDERDADMLVQAWFCADQWVQPVLYLCRRKDVRAILPERARLTDAVDATREHIGTAHWLHGLLLVLDDEPLIVLHRATGRGYRVIISGIGDNFQLHTMLAATLIGDESRGMLPGQRPTAVEIAAATDGEDLEPQGGIRGNFNLVDAHGEWIWNEGRPADIPAMDGIRVIVLDPPPYQRSWNAGRPYPLMRPTMTLDGPLPADQAAHRLSLVKPSQRG